MVARIARVSSKNLDQHILAAHVSDLEFQVTARDMTISMPPAVNTPDSEDQTVQRRYLINDL